MPKVPSPYPFRYCTVDLSYSSIVPCRGRGKFVRKFPLGGSAAMETLASDISNPAGGTLTGNGPARIILSIRNLKKVLLQAAELL